MTSKPRHLNWVTSASWLVALGIIYGDIGTSPLYALMAVIGKGALRQCMYLPRIKPRHE